MDALKSSSFASHIANASMLSTETRTIIRVSSAPLMKRQLSAFPHCKTQTYQEQKTAGLHEKNGSFSRAMFVFAQEAYECLIRDEKSYFGFYVDYLCSSFVSINAYRNMITRNKHEIMAKPVKSLLYHKMYKGLHIVHGVRQVSKRCSSDHKMMV
ncbi:hypothetical protein PsorP6_002296 [Peronosclerospora sorghi]|uniref:Uncharacterized protein n=1 Tax=Peronosclerospora sorghi TaxID=230839 RepID=A0ACC0WW43_9STRA|nr:hypothetical protein PsorP6_002296 [Peronosclerospora sorghi]